MENPIGMFHMVRRLVNDWTGALNQLDEIVSEPVKAFVSNVRKRNGESVRWPNHNDVEGTALGFVRLRDVYFLSFEELSTGTLNGTKSAPLTTEDMFEIARTASNHRLYYEAVEWFNFIIEKVKSEDNPKIHPSSVMRAKASAYEMYEDPWTALRIIKDAIILYPEKTSLKSVYKYYDRKVKDKAADAEPPKLVRQGIEAEWTHKYETLCRGDYKKKPHIQARLKCHWRKTSVPYKPADVEYVNKNPDIVLFHHVVSDKEIKGVIKRAKRVLARSLVVSTDGQKQEFSNERVSESGWLEEKADDLVKKLGLRVQFFTGLSTKVLETATDAEWFQVLNYGMGGMYNPHWDYFDETEHKWNAGYMLEGSGNRIATWMFYLSDVQVGGSTVFPLAGARVPVVKGAAAFWFNLKPDGSYVRKSLHAGCPVVIGSKWVSNKWIHTNGQMFRYPCPKGYKTV